MRQPDAARCPPPPRAAQAFVALTRAPVRTLIFHAPSFVSFIVMEQSVPSTTPPRAETSSMSASVSESLSARLSGSVTTTTRPSS